MKKDIMRKKFEKLPQFVAELIRQGKYKVEVRLNILDDNDIVVGSSTAEYNPSLYKLYVKSMHSIKKINTPYYHDKKADMFFEVKVC